MSILSSKGPESGGKTWLLHEWHPQNGLGIVGSGLPDSESR